MADDGRLSAVIEDNRSDGPDASDLSSPLEEFQRSKPQMSKGEATARNIGSWVMTIAIALGLVFVFNSFAFQAYQIPSPSMVSTLEVGDRVIVSKFSKDPGRGDIIVFDRPLNDPKISDSDPDVLIKRVIGLPGETVESRDGEVYIDETRIAENYLDDGTITTIVEPITVPEGELLVLGDNRSVSKDGRSFGTIPKDLIVGRAIARVWPISRFGTL